MRHESYDVACDAENGEMPYDIGLLMRFGGMKGHEKSSVREYWNSPVT